MDKILYNLALLDTLNFCRDNGIVASGSDGSGSHLVKAGRGFKYDLVRNSDGEIITTVTFHKSQVPTHTYNPALLGQVA